MNRYHIGDMIIHHDINHIIRKINNFLNIVWSIGWQKAEINISFVVPSIQNKHYISDFSPPLYIHLFFLPAAEDQAVLAENAHYVETVLAILRFNACRQTQAASKHQSLPGTLQELVIHKMDQLEPQRK